MRIRKLHIQNFRNLENVCIKPAGMMILVGENNAGKSNIIHSLRLLLDPMADRLRLDLTEADINDNARQAGKYWFSILLEVGDLQKHIEVETCFRERLGQDGDETYITIEGRYERDSDGILTFSVKLMPPEGRFNDPMPLKARMYRAIPLHYLDALRDAERETRASGRSALGQLLENLDISDVEENIRGHLRSANDALSTGSQIKSLSQGISGQLTQLLPGGQGQIRLTVTEDDALAIKRGIKLSYQIDYSAPLSDLSRYGTGLQNLILIALFRQKVASYHTGVPIFAIEEPEAHLYPHAQRRLYKDLCSIAAPVVISTHSPSIVKNAEAPNIVLVRSVAGSSATFQLDPSVLSDEDKRFLSQLMRGSRSELFFARSLIVVEGVCELIALPEFAKILGCDLDRDGISLVEADGNNFAYILKSCGKNQFSIPSVVTYDSDALASDNGLLKEAYKAGLISRDDRDICDRIKNRPPSELRREILDRLGWFAADECFEEEVCKHGYADVVLNAIRDNDPEKAV